MERCLLRNGNVASADDWRLVLEPIVARYRDLDIRRFFQGYAAAAEPEKCLSIPEIVIGSPERPATAVGHPGNLG